MVHGTHYAFYSNVLVQKGILRERERERERDRERETETETDRQRCVRARSHPHVRQCGYGNICDGAIDEIRSDIHENAANAQLLSRELTKNRSE